MLYNIKDSRPKKTAVALVNAIVDEDATIQELSEPHSGHTWINAKNESTKLEVSVFYTAKE